MLVLPLLFVFIVFSWVNVASLGVKISASGIAILNKPAGNTFVIDLAKEDEYALDVQITPNNATNKEYDVTYEPVEGAEFADVWVDTETGVINAASRGMARIVVKSRDGGFLDSVNVLVDSTKPYDFDFGLFAYDVDTHTAAGENVAAWSEEEETYSGRVPIGRYAYSTQLIPTGFTSPLLRPSEGNENRIIFDEGTGTVLFPFEGRVEFDVVIENGVIKNGVIGDLVKHVRLDCFWDPDSVLLVNASEQTNQTVHIAYIDEDEEEQEQASTFLYIQTGGTVPVVTPQGSLAALDPTFGENGLLAMGTGSYLARILFREGAHETNPVVTVTADGIRRRVEFEFSAYSFSLRTDATGFITEDEDGNELEVPEATLLFEKPTAFYTYSPMLSNGIEYIWDVTTATGAPMILENEDDIVYRHHVDETTGAENTAVCEVTSNMDRVTFVLRVQAAHRMADGTLKPYTSIMPARVLVTVVRQVTRVTINHETFSSAETGSLARRATLAGRRYEGTSMEIVTNSFRPNLDRTGTAAGDETPGYTVTAYDVVNSFGQASVSYVKFRITAATDEQGNEVDPDDIATVDEDYGTVTPKRYAAGTVTLSVRWTGGADFGEEGAVEAKLVFDIVGYAVQVRTSRQLFAATEADSAVVLASDVMLGTEDDGVTPLPEGDRRSILEGNRLKSTYNIEWYKNRGMEERAYVNYVLGITNNFYGNGYTVNAEYFTNVKDGSGVPTFFRGPLYFVRFAESASVAAQDNIAFLVKESDVTVYNTVLLGCNDKSLENESGEYDLTKLNNVGTTLEINANNVRILNCRVRNGRNVVRVYGGNSDPSSQSWGYMRETLGNRGSVDNERIVVTVDGCVISQGREFLLKVGSNRALRASSALSRLDPTAQADSANCVEPNLLDRSNNPYPNPSGAHPDANEQLLQDEYFYSMYVMTDITLKDSVLETSGLFTVGMESNFAGMALYRDSQLGSELDIQGISGWEGTGGTSYPAILRLVGDVRLYDWKDLNLVDSSTLISVDINSGNSNLAWLQLNIRDMIRFVCTHSTDYNDLITDEAGNIYDFANAGGEPYVHGGIAFYGGGKNYSLLDTSRLNGNLQFAHPYFINIDILTNGEDDDTALQGYALPLAAGTQDFRFYMYGAGSENSYQKQLQDMSSKYEGVTPLSPF